MSYLSNDHLELSPVIPDSNRVLEFDFPGFEIGSAEYEEGPTGCTVIRFLERVRCILDVRGGSPVWVGDYGWTDAICLTGGSAYGLESLSGVAAELLALSDYSPEWFDIALVSGAVIYDLGKRGNMIYPDKALGRAATRAARPGRVLLGPHGAGRSATVGKAYSRDRAEAAGQGAAFAQVGPTKILVLTVVNALGVLVDRSGRVVRGNRDRETGERRPFTGEVPAPVSTGTVHGNTTLTVVVTNQHLDGHDLRQVGRQVHSSMARAIQPFHAPNDGDVLFTVTAADVENEDLDGMSLALIASELAWDAVLRSFDPEDSAQ
ncbi:MAG TPA: P1 family peptidase [Chloroflexota bacterium]|nr:P1 family peptidase [Chloroflexota bacterium]